MAAFRLIFWPLAVGLAGCDTAPPAVPSAATPTTAARPPGHAPADKPDLHRLGYDPAAGTLTLYPLPDRGGRWLLVTPDQPAGSPVSGTVRLPAGLDPESTSVFYTVPDRRPSPRVTLAEIRETHTRQARG